MSQDVRRTGRGFVATAPARRDSAQTVLTRPLFIAQFAGAPSYWYGSASAAMFKHRFWDAGIAVPYINEYVGQGSASAAGAAMAATVNATAAVWRSQRTDEFRWACWPHNWGTADLAMGLPHLFGHPEDLVNGVSSPWSVNAVALWRSWSQSYFSALKEGLTGYGLPDPIYIDPDWEGQPGNLLVHGDIRSASDANRSFLILQEDPRYDSVTIDGRQTLREYLSRYTDLNGERVPGQDLFPPRYDLTTVGAARECLHSSIAFMTGDWALQRALYEPARAVFPGILCSNWNYFPASRDYPSFSYRPKETPVDFNTGMYADVGVMSFYATQGGWDVAQPDWSTELGVRQYYEMVRRYGIDTNQSTDEQFRALVLADMDFQSRAIRRAAPSKRASLWLSYQTVLFNGGLTDTITFTPDYIPGGASFHYNPPFLLEALSSAGGYGVSVYGLFDPDIINPSFSSVLQAPVLDFYADVFDGLDGSVFSLA